MTELCMVTYTRANEEFTPALVAIGNALHKHYSGFRCVVFTEVPMRVPDHAKFKVESWQQRGTKYHKLNSLLESDSADYFVSLDNDINAKLPNLLSLIDDTLQGNYDIAWGRVLAAPAKGLAAGLVDIDKRLSHRLIRPWLWQWKLGITVPGQCFVIKGDTYRGKLLRDDTFLDDLAIGLYSAKTPQIKVLQSSAIVVYEMPNNTLADLWGQRARWATGYAQILRSRSLSTRDRRLLYLHGVVYHGLWIPNLILAGLSASISLWAGVSYLLFVGVLLVGRAVSRLPLAVLYQLVFPAFHLRWASVLIREILKNEDIT